MKTVETIDEYIAQYPPEVQAILQRIRQMIQNTAPEATETMSYGIPTFKLNGNLVHFGAFTEHIGFYPGAQGIEVFKKKLSEYEGAKGSVRFPLNKPIPYELIKKITEYRAQESRAKKK